MKFQEVILPWLKQAFFKFGNNLIVKFLVRIGLKMTGPIGWIASLFIDKILVKAWFYIHKYSVKAIEYFETKKEVKEYKEKIENPNATKEEIKDAGNDFLSS